MKGFIILLGILGLASCHASVIPSKDCALQKILVRSTDPSRNEVYVAKRQGIEVQFRNENAPKPVEVFPDPLVTVKNITAAKSCDIRDGNGIWSGKSVYFDADERALILNEYSGATDALNFYDPKTCQRLAQLDVSNKRWEISGDRIRTGEHCKDDGITSCRSIQELRLDNHCLVKESKSRPLK